MGVEAVQNVTVMDLKPGRGRCLAAVYVLKNMLLNLLLEEAGKLFNFEVVVVLRKVPASHQAFRE
eukprot:1952339-Lingulodinium_polyedra.AAC.1